MSVPIGTILAKNARVALKKARKKYPNRVEKVNLAHKDYRNGMSLYTVFGRMMK